MCDIVQVHDQSRSDEKVPKSQQTLQPLGWRGDSSDERQCSSKRIRTFQLSKILCVHTRPRALQGSYLMLLSSTVKSSSSITGRWRRSQVLLMVPPCMCAMWVLHTTGGALQDFTSAGATTAFADACGAAAGTTALRSCLLLSCSNHMAAETMASTCGIAHSSSFLMTCSVAGSCGRTAMMYSTWS